MATITIDTYEAIQGLQHSGMPEPQAKAVVDTIHMVDLENVATKADMVLLKSDIKSDMLALQNSMQRWTFSMMLAQTGLIVALIKFL